MSDADFEAWIEEARRVPIENVAEALGIRMPARGEYSGPCILGCCTTDGFSINPKKGVFLCRKSGAAGDGISMVQHVRECDFVSACEYINETPPPRGETRVRERDPEIERERREEKRDAEIERQREEAKAEDNARAKAARLFEQGVPIAGTQAEDYLESRGILLHTFDPSDLRFIRDLSYVGYADADAQEAVELGRFHCMVAAMRDAQGRIQGLHRTYLDPHGAKKLQPPGDRKRNKAKKGMSKMGGGLIMLQPPSDLLAVGEGIETSLAWLAMARIGGFGDELAHAGVAAAYSLGNLCGLSTGSIPHPHPPRGRPNATIPNGDPDMESGAMWIPAGVKQLILLGDGDLDPDGEYKRETVAKLKTGQARFQRLGFETIVHMAPKDTDFNDILIDSINRRAA
jgi:hypothetical protein